jgi:hypothetical protein
MKTRRALVGAPTVLLTIISLAGCASQTTTSQVTVAPTRVASTSSTTDSHAVVAVSDALGQRLDSMMVSQRMTASR